MVWSCTIIIVVVLTVPRAPGGCVPGLTISQGGEKESGSRCPDEKVSTSDQSVIQ